MADDMGIDPHAILRNLDGVEDDTVLQISAAALRTLATRIASTTPEPEFVQSGGEVLSLPANDPRLRTPQSEWAGDDNRDAKPKSAEEVGQAELPVEWRITDSFLDGYAQGFREGRHGRHR